MYEWSSQFLAVDSIGQNINVTSIDNNWLDVIIMWERILDSTTTIIYSKNISTDGPEIQIAYEPNVRFTNPTISFIWQSNSFLVVFEKHSIDADNLYYTIINGTDIDSLMAVFDDSVGLSNPDLSQKFLTFQKTGNIYYTEYAVALEGFIAPIKIDSMYARSPKIFGETGSEIVWIYSDSISSEIRYKKKIYNEGWAWPDSIRIISNPGSNTNLTTSTFLSGMKGIPLWENQFYDTTTIEIFYGTYWPGWASTYVNINFEDGSNLLDPTGFAIDVIGRQNFDLSSMVAFVRDSIGLKSIYSSRDGYGLDGGYPQFQNISQYINDVRNPYIAYPTSLEDNQILVWCFWEEKINDQWQLMASTIINGISGSVDDNEHSAEFILLGRNYPNPFNASTIISYYLPVSAQIKLIIFNILGQEIKTLLNKDQEFGQHIAHWNGTDSNGEPASAGIYFYQIRAGDPSTGSGHRFVQTNKMILLK